MKITVPQIDAVRFSSLSQSVLKRVGNIAMKASSELSPDNHLGLQDACIDALVNDAPVVRSLEAEQDKGVYPIEVRGVPGAFWVFALEFDNEGVFSSIDEALSHVETQYGELLIRDGGYQSEHDPDPAVESEVDELSEGLLFILARSQSKREIEVVRQKILADPELFAMSRGNIGSGDALPSEASEAILALQASLPKPQGTISGMAQMSRVWKLRAYIKLYWLINRQVPEKAEIEDLLALTRFSLGTP